MIHYIFQIIAFQLLFLIVYDLFLKKETFFTWNRIYLIGTTILSVVLPLVKLEFIKKSIPTEYILQLPAVIIGESNSQNGLNTIGSIPVPDLIWQLWLLGVGISSIIFAYKYYQIRKLKKKGSKEFMGEIVVITLKDTDAAFSFFNTIFLGDMLSENQKATIVLHEKTHVEQYHSIDLLLFEIFRIIFWFNPLIYVFQNRMVILQEYIADAYVAKNKNKKEYYLDLLSQVFNTHNSSFINPFFNHSLIKKRIIMLQKSKSKKSGLLKYLLILPIVSVLLIYTSCAQETNKEEVKSLDQIEVKSLDNIDESNSQKSIPFAIIDKVPTYPGCTGDNESLKSCMSQKIGKFVGEEFNMKVSKESGISGKQRIIVQFKIDKTGSVIGIRAKAEHTELENEAIRVVSNLPQMLPGEHGGKVVAVQYSLPIVFEVKE